MSFIVYIVPNILSIKLVISNFPFKVELFSNTSPEIPLISRASISLYYENEIFLSHILHSRRSLCFCYSLRLVTEAKLLAQLTHSSCCICTCCVHACVGVCVCMRVHCFSTTVDP